MLHLGLGELAGRLHAPAGEHFIGVVVVMMMTAAAMTVMVVMMLVLLVIMIVVMTAAAVVIMVMFVMVVVMLVLMFVIIVMIVVVTAAAVVIMIVLVVVVVMMMLVLILVIILVIIMMMAAAAHTVLIVVMMVMLVLLFLVLVGVLLVGLGSHSDQLSLEVVLGGHGLQDLLTGQVIPCGGHDGGGGVLFAQHCHGGGDLFLAGGLGAAEQDAACVADLVVVELAEVLHIHLDLVHVGHGDKAVQLHIQMLGHAFHSAGHVGELAHAGGLDHDAVGVVLLHHLLQGGAEVTHQRAADAAGVQLVDLDAAFLQKAAVNADLAELVLDQNDLLAGKGLFDELFDQRSLTGTQEAGENIDFGHDSIASFFLAQRAAECWLKYLTFLL